MASSQLSAWIILYRLTGDLEVFWVRRSTNAALHAGFYAFPGGPLDAEEDTRAGAVRTLEEETGVRIEPSLLVDVGRWVMPPLVPQRLSSQLFMAACPEDQHPAIRGDHDDAGEWIAPGAALRKWREGRMLIMPAVKHSLECLVQGLGDIESRMKAVPEAQGEPASEVEVRAGILLVPVRTPTLPPATHTNCYIVGSREVVVIDPASPYEDEQAMLDRVLEKRGVHIREIWLTHLHRDHVGGANHLREKWKAPVAAHRITARDLAGLVHVDREFEPDEVVELPDPPQWKLRVLHTPGHARGHVCIFEDRNGSLITGDLIAGFGTVVIDPPEGHMGTYLGSLTRMLELPVTALFPGHGPVLANARSRIREYIDHRSDRECKILAAWQRGLREPSAIVPEAYRDVDPAMYPLAIRSVTAHLEKLQEEGRL